MPSDIVVKLIERVKALEVQMGILMSYQKWQIGLLTAILLMALKAWMVR